MLVKDILKNSSPAISFEYFPPKTEKASEELFKTIQGLNNLKPAYVSVTYGAGGGTRNLTNNLISKIQSETDLTVVSHLTCVGHTQDEIKKILEKYDKNNIHNILALRGDPPKGFDYFKPTAGGFTYASEMVAFIKKHFPHMGIGVAGFPEGHPGCPNRLKEIDYLKAKVDAGADYICTQLFFENRDFYDFKERCEIAGIKVPIIAGIMPISNVQGMKRMSELALGARFPAKLMKAINRINANDHEACSRIGVQWASEQVRDLLDNDVAGIHFYTLNKSQATKNIYLSLGLKSSEDLNEITHSHF